MFIKYCLIGGLNTALHWAVFYLYYGVFHFSQSLANLLAFLCAVHVSYYLNSKFNFKQPLGMKNYLLFIGLMSLVSFSIGWWVERYHGWPLLTLVIFSGSSLILGYLFSKYIIFRG